MSNSSGGRWSWSATRVPLPKASFPPWIDVSPAIARRSVVLPAPFAPASESRSLRPTVNETFSNNGSPANSLRSSDAMRTAMAAQGGVDGLRDERASGGGDVLRVDSGRRKALLGLPRPRHLADGEQHDVRRLLRVGECRRHGVPEAALRPMILDGEQSTARHLG